MGKSENHHWILHIGSSLDTKFGLKLTVLISLIKFAQKGYLWSQTKQKTKKQKNENHYQILQLEYVPGLNLPKKDISSLKQIKWIPPLNSASSN